MPHIYTVKVYLTRPQYEKIKQIASIAPMSMSSYLRHTGINNLFVIEQRVIENNKILKKLQQHLLKK